MGLSRWGGARRENGGQLKAHGRTSVGFPLVEELTPAPDPWETAQRLADLPHLLFLDSADRHSERGRYSFVAADPIEWIVASTAQPEFRDPFAALAHRLAEFQLPTIPGLPPFQGGLAGQFGYGLQHAISEYRGHTSTSLKSLILRLESTIG